MYTKLLIVHVHVHVGGFHDTQATINVVQCTNTMQPSKNQQNTKHKGHTALLKTWGQTRHNGIYKCFSPGKNTHQV